MKPKRLLILFIVTFHFSVIIVLSIYGFINGYNKYRGITSQEKISVERNLLLTLNLPPIKYYRSFSGLETSYGFFSPNVSSEVITIYEVKYPNNKTKIYYSPLFKSDESILKYSTSLQLYLDLLDKDNSYSEMAKKILKLNSKNYINSFKKLSQERIEHISLKVYLYHFPTLEEYSMNKKGMLFLLDSTEN